MTNHPDIAAITDRHVDRPGPPPGDGRISWCRVFRVGPPCPRLCGECAITDRRVTDPAIRRAILIGVEP